MKICPTCQNRYTDDTLKFCLQDGTPLIIENEETSAPTVVINEPETVVKPRSSNQSQFDLQNQTQTGYETNQDFVQPEESSNIFKIVSLTVLTMLVILGGIGAGAWLYFNNQKQIAQNTNTSKNTKVISKPTPDTNKTENAANNSNDNYETPTPTPTPTPEKTPEINPEQVKKEVTKTINSWNDLAEKRNLNDYMNYYADTLDYYTKRGVSRNFVRDDKSKAFRIYDDIDITISNVSITPDKDGATAVFDKEWVFDGEEKYSEGKVQSQLKLKRFGDNWKIVSERDLKTYYVNNE
jgi:hypothetical protein